MAPTVFVCPPPSNKEADFYYVLPFSHFVVHYIFRLMLSSCTNPMDKMCSGISKSNIKHIIHIPHAAATKFPQLPMAYIYTIRIFMCICGRALLRLLAGNPTRNCEFVTPVMRPAGFANHPRTMRTSRQKVTWLYSPFFGFTLAHTHALLSYGAIFHIPISLRNFRCRYMYVSLRWLLYYFIYFFWMSLVHLSVCLHSSLPFFIHFRFFISCIVPYFSSKHFLSVILILCQTFDCDSMVVVFWSGILDIQFIISR